MIETQAPIIDNCPALPVVSNDSTQNDPFLWNAPFWTNPFASGHDLDESAVDLSVTATDSCGLNARYLLFLDLDGDYRFSIQRAAAFGSVTNTYSVGWNTQQAPGLHKTPELPTGNHRIKWFLADDCYNESACDRTFSITNQTTAAGQPTGSTGFHLFPNSPNPFVDETLVCFQLPEPATATLEVRDLTGRLVFSSTERYAAGRQSIRLGQAELSSRGPLFCSLRTDRYFAMLTLLRM